ncbi:hypothetical protein [Micromonospora zamorensis]|uniref:Uncharacterized protein n=1 Tax=Micromonospora zamorensis TaxID=709883 RepID=A0ABZ1PMY9_9ACTN
MLTIHGVTTYLVTRWQDMTDSTQTDRGDSPVGTAVITAILVAGAIVVAGGIVAVATGWVDLIPTQP